MGIALDCGCGRHYTVKDDLAGKRVKCPSCGAVLTIPAPAIDDDPLGLGAIAALESSAPALPRSTAPAASSHGFGPLSGDVGGNDDSNPYAAVAQSRSRSRPIASGRPKGLKGVATGLSLVYWGIGLVLLSIIGSGVLGAVAIAAQEAAYGTYRPKSDGPAMLLVATIVVFVGGIVVGALMGIVGKLKCLSVPAKSGASELIIAAVLFEFAMIGLTIASAVGETNAILRLLSNLCGLISTLCFAMFLQRVAGFLGQRDLAARAQWLIGMGGLVFGLMIVARALAGAMPETRSIGAWVFLACIVLAIVMLFRYIRLLVDLRAAILGR